MEDKKSLASKIELAKVDKKASLLAAVDYYVSMQSDIFISASPGNMHNAMVSLIIHWVAETMHDLTQPKVLSIIKGRASHIWESEDYKTKHGTFRATFSE